VAVVCAVVAFVPGCARFDNTVSQPFTTPPDFRPGPPSTPPPPPPLPPKPFPKVCPAPGVMQGCLESTSGLIMGSDAKTALVAERVTGAVKEVSISAEPKIKTVIGVDGSGDGGLLDIVLSPTYSQDRLMYAYISTPTDNRVIRIADGDVPKDILTGIPKGAIGNAGSLLFTSPTTLVVQTGDAGDPGAANDLHHGVGALLAGGVAAAGVQPHPVALGAVEVQDPVDARRADAEIDLRPLAGVEQRHRQGRHGPQVLDRHPGPTPVHGQPQPPGISATQRRSRATASSCASARPSSGIMAPGSSEALR
jgi:glucose/arabinose dehydrogenase